MKILVSDFDRTFYTLEYEMNIEAINDFVEKGNLFIVATGRNLEQLLSDTVGYDIPISYYICNDGALIYDQNYQLLYQKDIDSDLTKSIFDYLDRSKFFGEVLIDQGGNYTLDTTVPANKIVARPSDFKKAEQELSTLQERYPKVIGYISQNWLNIIDVTVNKGNAVRFLQQKNKWMDDDIYTVGDSINDLSMNTMYRGYAMEESIEQLKQVSIGVVSNIREVLQIIEEDCKRKEC